MIASFTCKKMKEPFPIVAGKAPIYFLSFSNLFTNPIFLHD